MLPGQLTVQIVEAPTTVAEVLAELSALRGSAVALEIVATFVMTVPSGVPAFTCRVTVNTATVSIGRVASVHVIVPPVPAVGFTHVNAGPESCASDTKVVLSGIKSVRVTF
jgi:hypothetical protein